MKSRVHSWFQKSRAKALLIAICGSLFTYPTHAVDKSGVTPNTVYLPDGPGSVSGLGEAFQPTLNTGTVSYGFSLALPPNAGGMPPGLALNYEGGEGNGVLGVGWGFPTAYIQRQTSQGTPRYVDADNGIDDDGDGETDEPSEIDVFINEMREELVPVANGDTTEYSGEDEGALISYRRVDDYWEGTLPSGTRLIFGQSPSARAADSANPTRIFRWFLEQQIDTNGNTIHYTYQSFPSPDNLNQTYRKSIEYGAGAPPWTQFHGVAFTYEDRPDVVEDGRSGFLMRTGKRLIQIDVFTQGTDLPGHLAQDANQDGTTDYLNRRYRLDYDPDTFWSLLSQVTFIGADGISSLPPERFEYTRCSTATEFSATGAIVGTDREPLFAFDQDNVDFIDLNGDSLPDLLQTAPAGFGAHIAYFNQGPVDNEGAPAIRWSTAQQIEVPVEDGRAWELSLESDQVHMADIDADGLSDLVQIEPFYAYYYRNIPGSGAAAWGPRQLLSVQDAPPPSPFGPEGINVRTGDFNSDKRIDIIASIPVGNLTAYQIWFNLDNQTYARQTMTPSNSAYSFTDKTVKIADLNGDGMVDIARIQTQTVRVIASMGHGNFADEVLIPFDHGLDTDQIERAYLQDVNGDGLADLAVERAEPGELWFWINRGNHSFEPRRILRGMPTPSGAEPDLRWVDLNGNGTTDLVYADAVSQPRMQMVDIGQLLGCVPNPHLLRQIDNGIGWVTDIAYRTSVSYALEGGASEEGEYTYAWPDPLPFPVEVVSRILTSDSPGNQYGTEFSYRDGYYDPFEKQFRGFAHVEQTVPNVEGETEARAQVPLEALGLVLGTVSEACSDTVPEGAVVEQVPSAGALVAPGSAVALVVSAGPANQRDTDGDGLSDPCDPDDDGDGLSDVDELNLYFTNPLLADSDGDSFDDRTEVEAGTDPNDGADFPGAMRVQVPLPWPGLALLGLLLAVTVRRTRSLH